MNHLDDDLLTLTRDELVEEVRRLRHAVREHRDASGHNLCWHYPALWSLLPEQLPPQVEVPPWSQFMQGCVRYRASLDRELPTASVDHAEYVAPTPVPEKGE